MAKPRFIINREHGGGGWTNAVQGTGIKRTIGSFNQKRYVGYKRVTAIAFTFNDFGDKRTIRRILKPSFVHYKRLGQFSLSTKPDLDKRTIGRIITS
jgi:hypothetical protein